MEIKSWYYSRIRDIISKSDTPSHAFAGSCIDIGEEHCELTHLGDATDWDRMTTEESYPISQEQFKHHTNKDYPNAIQFGAHPEHGFIWAEIPHEDGIGTEHHYYFPRNQEASQKFTKSELKKEQLPLIPNDDHDNKTPKMKWFGDSTVRNPDGSPKVVYHGTDKNIDQFTVENPSSRSMMLSSFPVKSQGSFFGHSKEQAAQYGRNIIPVYIKMENPLLHPELHAPKGVGLGVDRLPAKKEKDIADILLAGAKDYKDGHKVIHGLMRDTYITPEQQKLDGDDVDHRWIYNHIGRGGLDWEILDNPRSVHRMISLGYDGTYVDENHDEEGSSIFVPHSHQIKHVNAKKFDPTSPLIHKSELEKGSLQSKNKVKQADYSAKDLRNINGWIESSGSTQIEPTDTHRQYREAIPTQTKAQQIRMLVRLGREHKIRKDPITGNYHVLLHRAMGSDEFNNSVSDKSVNHDKRTSWTSNHGIAKMFAGYKNKKIVSAWIPLSHIAHNLSLLPENKKDILGARVFGDIDRGENEFIVNPNHNSPLHTEASPQVLSPAKDHIKEFKDKKAKLISDRNMRLILNKSELEKGFKSQWGYGELPDKDNSHADRNEWWHGSPSGRFPLKNIHIGSKQAAHEALTATIGHPVNGEWDGKREYGKTLLAGKKTLEARGITPTGYSVDAPDEDHYPTGSAKYSDETPVALNEKPIMMKVRIKGPMTSRHIEPRTDRVANSISQRPNFKKGIYYVNEGEDSGSISAVVPSFDTHLELIKENKKNKSLGKAEQLANAILSRPDLLKNDPKAFFEHPTVKELLHNEIINMSHEVRNSQQGQRSGFQDKFGNNINTSSKSTFPSYYAQIGVKNKDHFEKVMNSKKGPIYQRMLNIAHDRLLNGYSNHHGYDTPHPKYIVEAVKHNIITPQEFHDRARAIDDAA